MLKRSLNITIKKLKISSIIRPVTISRYTNLVFLLLMSALENFIKRTSSFNEIVFPSPITLEIVRTVLGQKLGFVEYPYLKDLNNDIIGINFLPAKPISFVIRTSGNTVKSSLTRDYYNNQKYVVVETESMDANPLWLIVAFLYPECGKAVILYLLPNGSYNMVQLNWNWFFTFMCLNDLLTPAQMKFCNPIQVTITTGTSAMPLGICNVLIPRFKYVSAHIEEVSADDSVSSTYPIDIHLLFVLNLIILGPEYIHDMARDKPRSFDYLIGHIPPTQDPRNHYRESKLGQIFCEIMQSKTPDWNFVSTTPRLHWILPQIQHTPIWFSFTDILEIVLCLFDNNINMPVDVFTALLRVMGRMRW